MTVEKSLEREKMSRYPYIDRNPCIVALPKVNAITLKTTSKSKTKAGKPVGDPCATAKHLFQDVRLQDKVDAVRRQFGFLDTKDYSAEWMKPVDFDSSGAFTEIRHCLRPPIPTPSQALDEEIKQTIYDSYWNKPLGKGRDQVPGLPRGFDIEGTTFGKSTKSSEPGGHVINPPKKAEEVMAEEEFSHDLYAFSHQNYYPGEQIKMGYKPPFNENLVFGKPSKCDLSGNKTKKNLTWFNNDPISSVSRRQAAVRNRTLPPLGKGLDKTGVTDMLPEDHIYGKPGSTSFYGVADLLNECPPSLMRRDVLIFLACANKLRQTVYQKVAEGEIELEELYEEIMSLNNDENKDCSVHFDCIDRIMKRHDIYLDKSKLQPLLIMLGLLSQDGRIKVRDFINFIDKNSRFPEFKKEHYVLPPEFQNYNPNYQTGSESAKAESKIQSMPRAGMPTVRTDKPYPIYKDSLTNMDNLAEETTARALISPSIYTQYGLSHRDFFKPRSKEFLGNLFRKINVTITDEDLDEIYKEGFELDKTGGVCVETFRNILDDRAYAAYNRFS